MSMDSALIRAIIGSVTSLDASFDSTLVKG